MPAYIGRCKTKGCATTLRVDDGALSARHAGSVFTFAPVPADASLSGVGFVVGNYGTFARCQDHGLFPLKALRGTLNRERECNDKCRNATGASCDCQCGGANHGAGHTTADLHRTEG